MAERRQDLDMGLVYSMVNSKSSHLFNKAMKNDRPRTRQAAGAHGLVTQFARTDPRKYSFAVRTVEVWNNLPDDTKRAKTKDAFKARLKDRRP